MKNKTYLLGILAMVLVFTMTVTGCDFFNDLLNKDDDNGNGSGGKTIATELIGKWQAANSDGSLRVDFVNGVEFTSNTMKTINSTYPNGNTVSAYTKNNNIYWGSNEWPYSINGDILQITLITPGVPQILTTHKKVTKFTWGEGNNNGGSQNDPGDLAGTWKGTIGGNNAIITISGSGWTMTASNNSNFYDSGYFVRNGNSLTLYLSSGTNNGTATITNSNTIQLYLNSNTVFPGNYTLTKQP